MARAARAEPQLGAVLSTGELPITRLLDHPAALTRGSGNLLPCQQEAGPRPLSLQEDGAGSAHVGRRRRELEGALSIRHRNESEQGKSLTDPVTVR